MENLIKKTAEDTSLVECQIRGRHTDAEDERGNCKSNLNACLSPNVVTIATMCKGKRKTKNKIKV